MPLRIVLDRRLVQDCRAFLARARRIGCRRRILLRCSSGGNRPRPGRSGVPRSYRSFFSGDPRSWRSHLSSVGGLGMSLAPSSPMDLCLNLIHSAAAASAVTTKSNCCTSDNTYSRCGMVSVGTRSSWTQLLQILDILVTHRRSLSF